MIRTKGSVTQTQDYYNIYEEDPEDLIREIREFTGTHTNCDIEYMDDQLKISGWRKATDEEVLAAMQQEVNREKAVLMQQDKQIALLLKTRPEIFKEGFSLDGSTRK